MSTLEVTLTDVTILTPAECDKMSVSEADNSILFFSSEGSIVERWSFDSIKNVCLYSKRENKVQIKFVSGQKPQLKFNTLPEMEHFFQVMSALAKEGKIALDHKKIVQPPVRAGPNKVKEVVDKFETLLAKKEPELVLQPPKTTTQSSSSSSSSSSSKVKEQVKAKLNEQLVARMKGSTPRPPTPKSSSIVPNAIRKVWKGLTSKPKQKNITLTVAPILQKSEATKNEDSFPGTSKSEDPKPQTSNATIPKAAQPQAHKVTVPTHALQPKPNDQIKVVEKKVKSELYRLVEQAMEKEIKAMQHEPNKPKIVGVTFKD